MNILSIIRLLQSQGHNVKFYHRKDGGYVITNIDGQSFSAKTGNTQARAMTGQKLSHARSVQLKRIATPKGKRPSKKTPIPEDIRKEMLKVQRAWRKTHPDISGTISTRGVRYQLQHYGKKATLLSLDKAFRYSQGLAYTDNVNWLVQRIENDLSKQFSAEMYDVIKKIQQRALDFKEEWISQVYEIIYEWEKGSLDAKETARRINSIIQ